MPSGKASDPLAGVSPRDASGGHQQRLAIQRSLTREERDSDAVAWFYTDARARAPFGGSDIQLGGRWILRLKHAHRIEHYIVLCFEFSEPTFYKLNTCRHARVQGSSLFSNQGNSY